MPISANAVSTSALTAAAVSMSVLVVVVATSGEPGPEALRGTGSGCRRLELTPLDLSGIRQWLESAFPGLPHLGALAVRFAAAPGRIALITDAMAAAAAPPGRYVLGELDVDVADGRAVVAGTETLAGSTLTPDRALRTVVNDCDVSLHDAIAALTTTPARAIGELDPAVLVAGARAEHAVLDAGLFVTEVLFR